MVIDQAIGADRTEIIAVGPGMEVDATDYARWSESQTARSPGEDLARAVEVLQRRKP